MFGLFRLEILEFHQSVILIIVCAGYAGHLEIGTAYGVVLLDGERIVAAQVAGAKLEEGATDKVLVDLVEHLRRELPEILLEIVLHQRLETAVFREAFVGGYITGGTTFYMVHLVIIVHVDTAHREVGQYHAIIVT